MGRTVVALTLVLLFDPCHSLGQGRPQLDPLPRAFIGAGGAIATGDQDHRLADRVVDSGLGPAWIAEAGAPVTKRLGLGLEVAYAPEATGVTSGLFGVSRGRQVEWTVMGLVRARAAGSARIALDLLGGAGLASQRYEAYQAPCITGCAESLQASLTRHSIMFGLGGDTPIRLSSRVALSPFVRWYLLRRGETSDLVRWQFEHRSSGRVMAGITGRMLF